MMVQKLPRGVLERSQLHRMFRRMFHQMFRQIPGVERDARYQGGTQSAGSNFCGGFRAAEGIPIITGLVKSSWIFPLVRWQCMAAKGSIVMAYSFMVCIVMAYIVMAAKGFLVVMAYSFMICIVMAYIGMAAKGMLCIS